ncbi:AfsR/SARP family transcriptional regulator [Streptantibioticus ferralitis]|uniref:BTAD domain-containing putative transcriptional regulator n=1 Tax=Streptantibioticus ferralitis TaxID=236510 RepID=A0ABT5Z808_9ACTN|nr:BTAD domain-containing putative transcriptional regulator [Streptantibioticus ferralitis]MDF2259958.1 BTAD domain-containing putative transcriptional regulator [Streptantibioticus ferralitis]
MRYLILGTTEVAGTPLAGARLRAILTALALRAGRPVAASVLIGEVWGGDEPEDAHGALQALVSRLRRALGRDEVASGPAGYVLRAKPEDVDLFVFERLTKDGGAALDAGNAAAAATALDEALALWRGPALADLPDRTAAARPEALRLTALQRRAEAYLALGRAADVLPQAQELVAEHPLNEPFHAQYIRALRAVGRTADALAAYEQARHVLADSLGADPGAELRALHAELLNPPPLAPASPPAAAPPPAASRPAPERSQEPPAGAPPSAESLPEAPAQSRLPHGNLRTRLTSFVGREDDLRSIRADMTRHRLVTLVGAGGSGKTRLAEQAGTELATAYPDGVWVAELAPVASPGGVARAVLNSVGRSDTTVLTAAVPVAEPTERLLEHCAQRRMLLVLDNCEHVIGAAARTAEALLAHCPGVTVLATSREPLGVPGEAVRPVEPLPPPPAHRLFAERAAAVRPGFAVDADLPAVAEICRRLDGLPLAIELAAARLRMLTPRQIADRLDDRFRLLTTGSRTVLPRQQTLRAVVDWSWELLDDRERTVLRRVCVFSGGCTLAAAEAVCTDGTEIRDTDVLHLIGSLVDKSLLVADESADGVRYRLLETIQEYARARAAEHPEESAATARRHAAYFHDFAQTAAPLLHTRDQLPWLDRLETELDNVRGALERVIAEGDEETALAMAAALGWFWWLRNYRDESIVWLRRIAALGEPPEDPADPLGWSRMDLRLMLFFISADQPSGMSADELNATARRISELYAKPGPHGARFPGLLWPFAGFHLGRQKDMRALTDAMVATCRKYGGDWEIACGLMFRMHVIIDLPGGLNIADGDWAELTERTERVGDRWLLAQAHGASAELATARGQYATARADYEASMRLCEELGARAEIPFLVARLAELATREGDDELAVKLLERAEREADHYGIWDGRTYIRCVQSSIAIRAGELARARELCGLARTEAERGTPPPMFNVFLTGLDGDVLAAEGRPREALDALRSALREGLATHCPEPLLASIAERSAAVLLELGQPADAVRVMGAAAAARGSLSRSVPEEALAARASGEARAALDDRAYQAAYADGLRRTLAEAADLLDGVTGN